MSGGATGCKPAVAHDAVKAKVDTLRRWYAHGRTAKYTAFACVDVDDGWADDLVTHADEWVEARWDEEDQAALAAWTAQMNADYHAMMTVLYQQEQIDRQEGGPWDEWQQQPWR